MFVVCLFRAANETALCASEAERQDDKTVINLFELLSFEMA
jgi:hypothetical protein